MKLDADAHALVAQITDEFIRLGVSTDDDPYSGLMAQLSEADDSEAVDSEATDWVINIYDDYADGDYDGEAVLVWLKSLKPGDISLSGEGPANVWQGLRGFEI